MTINVRIAQRPDAPVVTELLAVLGYPSSEEDVRSRMAAIEGSLDHSLQVGEVDGEVVGLYQIEAVRLIATAGYAEVHALVVATNHQRKGVGSVLMRHAIEWAFAKGYERVRLHSGLHREWAHQFYESLGFTRAKASYAFEIVPRASERLSKKATEDSF